MADKPENASDDTDPTVPEAPTPEGDKGVKAVAEEIAEEVDAISEELGAALEEVKAAESDDDDDEGLMDDAAEYDDAQGTEIDETVPVDPLTEEPLPYSDAETIETVADIEEDSAQATTYDTEPTPPPAVAPPPPPPSRGGMGVLTGGILAAVLGAGALYLSQAQGWLSIGGADSELLARIDALEGELTAAKEAVISAEAEIAALQEAAPDLGPLTTAIDEIRAASEGAATASGEEITTLAGALSALTTRLDETDTRLEAVAIQQIPEAELPQAISDAYDAKLADLLATIDGRFETMQGAMTDRFNEIDSTFTEKLTSIEAAEAEAEQAQIAAAAAARVAAAQAALANIRTALDSGIGYTDALANLSENSDAAIPAALSENAETGVPSIAALADVFPAYARAALSASAEVARDAGTMSRWEAFMSTQLGARSLEPREGDDPDAVLSRAEAAVAAGDLDTAQAEIAALPDVGQAAMADWLAMVETRKAAVDGAAALAAELDAN